MLINRRKFAGTKKHNPFSGKLLYLNAVMPQKRVMMTDPVKTIGKRFGAPFRPGTVTLEMLKGGVK